MFIREIYIGVRKRATYNLLLIILLGIAMTLCYIVMQNQGARDFERIHYASLWDDSSVYATYDTLYEQQELERSYFSEKGSQYRVQYFIDALEANEDYPYYICGTHPINVVEPLEVPLSCYYVDDDALLKAHQINKNVQSSFPVKVVAGRTFSGTDFDNESSDIIPVILGNSYSGYIEVGTILEVEYMTVPVKIEVIGIAERDTYFPLFDSLSYEDEYIIMPTLRAVHEPRDDDESFLQKANALQNCSGYFRLSQEQTLNGLVDHLNQMIAQYGMFEVRLMRISSGRLMALNLSSESQRALYIGISCTLSLYSLLAIIMLVYTNTRKNARKYSILYIAGAPQPYISSLVMLEALVLAIGAFAFSIILSVIIGRGAIEINLPYSSLMIAAGTLCTLPAIKQLYSSSILYIKNY